MLLDRPSADNVMILSLSGSVSRPIKSIENPAIIKTIETINNQFDIINGYLLILLFAFLLLKVSLIFFSSEMMIEETD